MEIRLDSDKIIKTVIQLEKRISDRFPDSSLRKVCLQFLEKVEESKANIEWILKPNIPIKLLSYLIVLIGVGGLVYSVKFIDLKISNTTFTNIVTVSEAVFNDIVLLGAAIFFLVTMESRINRRKALKSLSELRALLHVIDMHQLTKDPTIYKLRENSTFHSPKRVLSEVELQRYLDYCSEASALVSKTAALYAQSLPDEIVVSAVNEIESLSTGLSRKIWQKLIILNNS